MRVSRFAAFMMGLWVPFAALAEFDCENQYDGTGAFSWYVSIVYPNVAERADVEGLLAEAILQADAWNPMSQYETRGEFCASFSGTKCNKIKAEVWCDDDNNAGTAKTRNCAPWSESSHIEAIPFNGGTSQEPAVCAPECGDPGDGYAVQVRAATATGAKAGVGTCYNQCAVQEVRTTGPGIDKDAAGTFSFLLWVKNTGEVCGGAVASPKPDAAAEEPNAEQCRTSAAGLEVCDAAAYGENCGYINDQFVCLGKTDADECWVNPDGSRFCGENAPMPPVPDNGTSGVRATPSDTVAGETTNNTYNYYTSGQVAGSSRDAGESGANPNRPTSTNPSTGPTPTVEQGDGEGGGGGGEEVTAPELDDVCEFQACTEAFLMGLQATPIVEAWTGITSASISGACPAATVTIWGNSYSLTEWACDIWDDQVNPLLSLVFLFVWPFLGLRIVMSA